MMNLYGLVAVYLHCGVPRRSLLRDKNDIVANEFSWRLEGAEVLNDFGLESRDSGVVSMGVLALASVCRLQTLNCV